MATTGHSRVTNWGVILNAGLLVVVIIGAWFSTFSNPLIEKFTALERHLYEISSQKDKDLVTLRTELLLHAAEQDKALKLGMETTERLDRHDSDSLDRRFTAAIKEIDELKSALRDSLAETERRRIEVATKADLQASLQASRLEFLAEIKRVDQQATNVATAAMSRNEFNIWKSERDSVSEQLWRRLAAMEAAVRNHTTTP